METFTIREAAERCEVSYQLMRKRVDRGTIPTVKRDGIRLVPRAELERAGLWPGSEPQLSDSQELTTLRQQLAETEAALASRSAQLEAERQARELAEASLHEHRTAAMAAEAQREAATAVLEPLTEGGFLSSVRALRALRSGDRTPPAPRVPAAA